ncbi:MAG: DUF1501 domain-containing protein [Acidobacteria bacterium]|nr:DUF1501 domain-containing protein [Acidobacteriota bacterium]
MSNSRHSFEQARRQFLLKTGAGLGWVALADLLDSPLLAQQAVAVEPNAGLPGLPHFPPKARRVIYLHMLGAMSQADTFDYKPMLEKMHGQELPESVRGNRRLSTMVAGQTSFPIVGPVATFKPYGQSGAMISDLMQNVGKIADDITIIKTMYTEHVNHDPASKFLHTGFQIAGRPSLGAWASYALGSENKDLPIFVVMSEGNVQGVPIDASTWSTGFIPSHYQGVLFRSGEAPVTYISNPSGLTRKDRRDMLDAIAAVSKAQFETSHDPEIPSKINQYEMSYRMQQSVPQVADISDEPEHVLALYGEDVKRPGTFARNCLIARRLAERDVRYTMAVHLGWDAHNGIAANHQRQCREVDQAAAGLVMDLKQRGMLDDTLVVFATEFGRTSFAQGELKSNFGRDHHGGNFAVWLAGGGVKRGFSYGETDDFSYNIVKDGVHIHDLNATILHVLGIDHERLTYRSQGRDFRLTDVGGTVVKGILA